LILAYFWKDNSLGRKRGQRWCRDCKSESIKKFQEKKRKLKQRLREIYPKTGRTCCRCKQELSLDNFYTKLTGYQSQCKQCTKEDNKERISRGYRYSISTRVRVVKNSVRITKRGLRWL